MIAIIPVSRGGLDNESNWVSTSQLRNSAKSNWLLKELGWALHAPGKLDDWDGMVFWYINHVEKFSELLTDSYLSIWYRAARRAVAHHATFTLKPKTSL